jgi:hypothetical protein
MAGRTKALAYGSAGWILEERHQSNGLVAQELEDFGFSVRNELEWLNEHMTDVLAHDGQYVAPAISSRALYADSLTGTTSMSSKHPANYAARRLALPARRLLRTAK